MFPRSGTPLAVTRHHEVRLTTWITLFDFPRAATVASGVLVNPVLLLGLLVSCPPLNLDRELTNVYSINFARDHQSHGQNNRSAPSACRKHLPLRRYGPGPGHFDRCSRRIARHRPRRHHPHGLAVDNRRLAGLSHRYHCCAHRQDSSVASPPVMVFRIIRPSLIDITEAP